MSRRVPNHQLGSLSNTEKLTFVEAYACDIVNEGWQVSVSQLNGTLRSVGAVPE